MTSRGARRPVCGVPGWVPEAAPPARPAAPPPLRRGSWWGLVAAVLAAHGLLTASLVDSRIGWGRGRGDNAAPRIEVAFVRDLLPTAPPAAAPRAAPVPAPARQLPAVAAVAAVAQPGASAPLADGAAPPLPPLPLPASAQAALPLLPDLPPDVPTDVPPNMQPDMQPDMPPNLPPNSPLGAPPAPGSTAAVAANPGVLPDPAPNPTPIPTPLWLPPPGRAVASTAVPTASAPAATADASTSFDWPPSTRMNYQLTGHYRGPVNGQAQVEWLREGSRYQVRMSTSIGPVLSRSIASEGELTPQGLAPRRFDAEQKVLFRAARRWSLRFGPERIVNVDGREIDSLPGAQDEASQFVQLTWLFTTRPERLTVGQAIELPLIVSRTLDRWTYDVVAEELLQFPFGAVPSVHVKPRRQAQGGDLSAEIWFAPTLQYLPVRILIRQGADSWIDLTLERPPLQAAAPR